MPYDWIVTIAPVLGLAIDVAVQIAVAHSSRRTGLSILAGAGAGFVAVLLVTAFVAGSTAIIANVFPHAAVAILTYLALAFGFWTFLNLNITSLRIRMLREMLNAGGPLSRTAIMSEYSADEFLRRRLERLQNGKQLSHTGGRWRLESGTLLVLARTLEFVRAVIMPPPARK